MGSDFFDLTAIGTAFSEFVVTAVSLITWVIMPFAIAYGLPFLSIGRKSLNAMWVLAAFAVAALIWVIGAPGGPFGYKVFVLVFIAPLAYGLVLSCSIREVSLRRNLSWSALMALAIGGFATMPAIVAGLTAHSLWTGREPNAACLATFQTVEVAGTRYRLPNAPLVVMSGESRYRTGWVINQRLRDRCASAENSETSPRRSGFSLDLFHGTRTFNVPVARKACANRAPTPRWMFDACAAADRTELPKIQEAFAATHLPLELTVEGIPSTSATPYTLVEEHRRNLRRRENRPYRELPGTASYSVFADGEQPNYGETRFWIRKDAAEPEAFACRRFGNDRNSLELRCKARYARGTTMIAYEFRTQLGREEDEAARIDARVLDVLAELAAPNRSE